MLPSQEQQPYLDMLSDPNPIQKRTLVSPQSIFPIYALPEFTFSDDPEETFASEGTLKKETLELAETSFRSIFGKPIYCANSRIKTGNNSQYGTVEAQAKQSKVHSPILSTGEEGQISFQSRFESGNLAFAAISPTQNREYFLLLQKDINTRKCTQWFFFEICNRSLTGEVTLHILNFVKSNSSFENGMKVAVCSRSSGYQWTRGCNKIKYRKTNVPEGRSRYYYALSMTYKFTQENQSTYLAFSYPYTFSMLDRFLLSLADRHPTVKRKTLTTSPGGNYIDLLTITNADSELAPNRRKKRVVFITSRVHPGETPSSFVMEGLIKFLVGSSPEADMLRSTFVFKLVPMLNPDGVINGNYRCSLSGNDLNRVWNKPDRDQHPEIFSVKKQLTELGKCFLFIDLHAHSRRKGIFMYGCQNRLSPYICRQMPFLFWKNVPAFNYYQCNFNIQKGRDGTSRMTVWRSIGVEYSYTMEHSFCGPCKEKTHFTAQDYANVGKSIAKTLHKFFCRIRIGDSADKDDTDIFTELYSSKELLAVGDEDDGDSSSDGELEPLKFKNLQDLQLPSTRKFSPKKQKQLASKRNTIETQNAMYQTTSKIRESSLQRLGVTRYNGDPFKFAASKLTTGQLPLPIVNPELKQQPERYNKYNKFRGCYSSLSEKKPKQVQERAGNDVVVLNRYIQEEANTLSDLFLPSLKNMSYKKYEKSKFTKAKMIHIAKPLSEMSYLLKDEIKQVGRRRPNLKDQIRNQI